MKKTKTPLIKNSRAKLLISKKSTALRSHLLKDPLALLEFKKYASSLETAHKQKIISIADIKVLLDKTISKSASLIHSEKTNKLATYFSKLNSEITKQSRALKEKEQKTSKPKLVSKKTTPLIKKERGILISQIESSNFKTHKDLFLKVYDSFPSIRERYNVITSHLKGNSKFVKEHIVDYNAFLRDFNNASKTMKSKNPVDILFTMNFELFAQAESFLKKDYSNIPSSRLKFFIENLK